MNQAEGEQPNNSEIREEPGRTPGQAEGRAEPDQVHTQRGEPGRTPGSAEGDRETVEESLRDKEERR